MPKISRTQCKSCLAAFLAYLPCLRLHATIQDVNGTASQAFSTFGMQFVFYCSKHTDTREHITEKDNEFCRFRPHCDVSFFSLPPTHSLWNRSLLVSLTIIYCFIHDNPFNLCEFLVSMYVGNIEYLRYVLIAFFLFPLFGSFG